jgi:vacuolar protein sorting-associated protein 41
LLSKTGQTKRALNLIINTLSDVSMAIAFAKDQDDPDLWNDLLDYSMDKPRFIRGLLEEVGTAIDPIALVKRIPEGLEIEGLRDGVQRMVREYEIQHSISEGVAKVLRGEVAAALETLRAGQKKAVKFEVVHEVKSHEPKAVEVFIEPAEPTDVETIVEPLSDSITSQSEEPKPGHCVGCSVIFHEDEKETLIGFACGHVYHLSCLLEKSTSTDARAAKALQTQFATNAADETGDFSSRSVGAKVNHAHLIKSALKNGCPVCLSQTSD